MSWPGISHCTGAQDKKRSNTAQNRSILFVIKGIRSCSMSKPSVFALNSITDEATTVWIHSDLQMASAYSFISAWNRLASHRGATVFAFKASFRWWYPYSVNTTFGNAHLLWNSYRIVEEAVTVCFVDGDANPILIAVVSALTTLDVFANDVVKACRFT